MMTAADVVYPHLPYADAVFSAMAEAGLPPVLVNAGLREGKRPSASAKRGLPGSRPGTRDALTARFHWDNGQALNWSSASGWQWSSSPGEPGRPLLLPELAHPRVVADAVQVLAGRQAPAPGGERWENAHALECALIGWEELR